MHANRPGRVKQTQSGLFFHEAFAQLLWFDGFLIGLLSIFYFDDDSVLYRVMSRIQCRSAGNGRKILCCSKRISYLGRFGAIGSLNGIDENISGVIAENRHGVRNLTIVLLIGFHKSFRCRAGILRRIMIGEESIIQRCRSSNFDQLGSIPTVKPG